MTSGTKGEESTWEQAVISKENMGNVMCKANA